jgi:glycosyltransferase involved in cell wall biosynthesis
MTTVPRSTKAKPVVSVVIPVYNGERFIAAAIESVLHQTFSDLECIVVDDGSTDATSQLIDAYGSDVVCVRKQNSGVASARNEGIRIARGRYVAFLDADDVWLKEKVARQVELAEATQAALVYTGLQIVDEELRPISEEIAAPPAIALRNSLLLEQPYMSIPSTSLILRAVLEDVGGFDERMSTSADTDLGCRLALRYPIAAIPEPLVFYRTHSQQMHHDAIAMEHDMLLLYRKFFQEGLAPDSLRKLERRARANLYFTLAAYTRHSSWRASLSYLRRALQANPLRAASLLWSSLRPRRLDRRSGLVP